MDFRTWYDALAKPAWTPARGTISVIWTILCPIIVVSFGFVFVQTFKGKLPWLFVLPFFINLIANLLFFPIFSGLRNLRVLSARLPDPRSRLGYGLGHGRRRLSDDGSGVRDRPTLVRRVRSWASGWWDTCPRR